MQLQDLEKRVIGSSLARYRRYTHSRVMVALLMPASGGNVQIIWTTGPLDLRPVTLPKPNTGGHKDTLSETQHEAARQCALVPLCVRGNLASHNALVTGRLSYWVTDYESP